MPWASLEPTPPKRARKAKWDQARRWEQVDQRWQRRKPDARWRRCRRGARGRRADPGQHRAGDRGQARDRQVGARGAARRRPPADRGRPRRRQDDAEQGARPLHRLHRPPDPVHPRPAALRRHRGLGVQPGHPPVRVPARRDLRQRRRRRRDQPGQPQDPVGDARVHGGGPGHRRRDDVRRSTRRSW